MKFTLKRFNPSRLARGARAAEFECVDDGGTKSLLWMSDKEIRANQAEFGFHPELSKGLEHYRSRREYPERESANA